MMEKLSISYIVLTCLLSTLRAEEEYQRLARDRHNYYRQKHHVVDLESSDDLNDRAVQCAKYYLKEGNMKITCPHTNGAGENIYFAGFNYSAEVVAKRSAEVWYEGGSEYDYNKDQQRGSSFAQMVWKSTTQFGFGHASNKRVAFGCALYYPAGKIVGEYKDNVLPP